MVNIKIIDHRGHSERNDLTTKDAEMLISSEFSRYYVVDEKTKKAITDLSTLSEDQTVILVPIVAGG